MDAGESWLESTNKPVLISRFAMQILLSADLKVLDSGPLQLWSIYLHANGFGLLSEFMPCCCVSIECDLAFPGNKLVSQKHCAITKEEDGKVYLTDTRFTVYHSIRCCTHLGTQEISLVFWNCIYSTNGTQVDSNRIKNSKVELHHGDEIHIVFRKSNKESSMLVRPTCPTNLTQPTSPIKFTHLHALYVLHVLPILHSSSGS